MVSKNWNDFETYTRKKLLTESGPTYLSYTQNKSSPYDFSRIEIYRRDNRHYIVKKLWHQSRDYDKYYYPLQFLLFDPIKFPPSITANEVELNSEQITTIKKLVSGISIVLPQDEGRIVLAGNSYEVKFGEYTNTVTLEWLVFPEENKGLKILLDWLTNFNE